MMMSSVATQTAVNTAPPRLSRMDLPSAGILAAMPAKISRDIPLPMPRSVTNSPIHITRVAPAVITSTMMKSGKMPLSSMMSNVQPCSRPPLAASATMLVACKTASATERYRVYWVILACPA